jgi:alpha-N-arabinofuranosidase
MDHFIESVVATADAVGAERKSKKKINISFDEWNVWYISRYHNVDKITDLESWPIAPRLLEDSYSVVDAVVVGNLLISLLKHADRVTSASLAQLVNVIAPIMTEPGGAAWRQATFFPFAATSAHARGEAVTAVVDAPSYATATYGDVPVLDAVATFDAATGQAAIFVVNRSEEPVELDVRIAGSATSASARTLSDSDPDAANTLTAPDRVGLTANDSLTFDDATGSITLPPISWTEITFGITRA